MTADPFGTAAVRERVLAAWAASPARFREDANAEQDLTHGAYRDRLLVELAQNAADAAARAGVAGHLRLVLAGGELRAANTGAPLDAAGVEGLATLRASAKRDGASVGRFGVGFAAVLTVTDEPAVLSRSGGVRFSAAGTRALVAGVPALAAELDRRGGQVPVLRLPWPAGPLAPPGPVATADPTAGPTADPTADPTVGAQAAGAPAAGAPAAGAPADGAPGGPGPGGPGSGGLGPGGPGPGGPGPGGPGAGGTDVGGVGPGGAGPGAVAEWATEVRLPLRAGTEALVRELLADLDPVLLLALPALRSIDAGGRLLVREDADGGSVVLRDSGRASRWLLRSRRGTLPAALLAGLPAEERDRPGWTVSWALPVDGDGRPVRPAGPRVVHAPTPTDEPLALPAVLLGTFPLGPDRRRVVPGPVTDVLVRAAAGSYADLVAGLPADPSALALVPRPQLAAGELDAALCAAVLDALRATPWLPTAPVPAGPPAGPVPAGPPAGPVPAGPPAGPVPAGPPAGLAPAGPVPADPPAGPVLAGPPAGPVPAGASVGGPGSGPRVAPGDAVVVDAAGPELVAALAGVLPGLLPADWSGRTHAAALAALGVRRIGTAEVVDAVAGLDRPPAWWHALYAALGTADREELAGLPVPLADGRTVTGARGVLLPDADLPAAAAGALGLRVVHPDAAHRLLERLGAVPATARGVLADDRVLAAVAGSFDDEDPGPVADAVLALVAGARPAAGEVPELAELALPGADGEWYPAGELLLPGSPLAAVVDPDAPFGTVRADLVERWGPDVLAAVGVLRTFAVLRAGEVEVDPDTADHDLDGEADWMEAVLDRLPPQPVPPRVDLVAVRDLDLVADWAGALPLLHGVAPTAAARLADGRTVEVPSYTTWWLATHRTLAGRRPDRLRTPAATDLAGLYDAVDAPAVTGVLTGLDDALADPDRALELLDRLGDPDRTVPAATLRTVHPRLALVLEDRAEPPDRVRVAPGRTVARADAVVLDRPYLLPLLGHRTPVPAGDAPGPVADLLDLPLAGELAGGIPDGPPGPARPWVEVPGAELAAARCGAAVPAGSVTLEDRLTVGGVPVPWWPDGEVDRTDGSPAALGRALAWRLGAWARRAAAVEALARPADADLLAAEDTLDPP